MKIEIIFENKEKNSLMNLFENELNHFLEIIYQYPEILEGDREFGRILKNSGKIKFSGFKDLLRVVMVIFKIEFGKKFFQKDHLKNEGFRDSLNNE